MKGAFAWLVVGTLLVGLGLGCDQNKKKPETVETAPPQEKLAPYPETGVPPPEPQPAPVANAQQTDISPPVDTSGQKSDRTTATKSKSKQAPKEHYSTSAKKTSHSYTVKKGDTLQEISQKFYGTTTKWQKIYQANKKTIGKDPNELTVGSKLVIP